MKSLQLLVFSLLFIGSLYAQPCTIDGTIKGIAVKKIQLYLLYADYVPKQPSAEAVPDMYGKFKQTLQLPYPVFAELTFNERKYRLLLSPGRNLQLTIDSTSILFAGKAAAENQLVHNSILDSKPLFSKNEKEIISFKDLTKTGFTDTLLRHIEEEIATTKTQIEQSATSPALKQILINETKYAYQSHLSNFATFDLRKANKMLADTAQNIIMQWQPLPDSSMLQSGYYANVMLEKRNRYDINQASKKINTNSIDTMKLRLAEFFSMPFTTIDSLIKANGELTIMASRYAELNWPASICDKVYYNLFISAYDLSNTSTCTYLFNNMQQKYPASQYLPRAKNLLQQLTATVKKNSSNANITIEELGNISSVLQVIKKYEGKVIYLDMWGTWCGPCKYEMAYVPELKKRYAGKNIVWLYIALDNPEQDKKWKDYIYINNLEGKHYRVNRASTETFWQEAEKTGIQPLNSVPRYMIINAQGKIVHDVAERPSSRQKLYNQLDKLL
ncbi:TlpA family protein disulfide reductase [Niastella sp. OAS944]|uniref:TlpA family protein disulfide reductase n=1 Tax=Niastella sp. OAS944 TaxID=2664089 RepID=UPI00348452BE|nr:thiol-disulfide isomerase/thioredoxin [Chitinophagaceae bacterium OAS944]